MKQNDKIKIRSVYVGDICVSSQLDQGAYQEIVKLKLNCYLSVYKIKLLTTAQIVQTQTEPSGL